MEEKLYKIAKETYIDEIHISCNSEYGSFITIIDNLHNIKITHKFIEEERLEDIIDEIYIMIEEERNKEK